MGHESKHNLCLPLTNDPQDILRRAHWPSNAGCVQKLYIQLGSKTRLKGLKIVGIPGGFFCLIPPGLKIQKRKKAINRLRKGGFPMSFV